MQRFSGKGSEEVDFLTSLIDEKVSDKPFK
jgi:hypothetical protein